MNWQPTREQLELAALACGKTAYLPECRWWQPNLPTTQGKADLLDLIEAIPISILWVKREKRILVRYDDEKDNSIFVELPYKNDNKHAALAKAAITVAALVGERMKEKQNAN